MFTSLANNKQAHLLWDKSQAINNNSVENRNKKEAFSWPNSTVQSAVMTIWISINLILMLLVNLALLFGVCVFMCVCVSLSVCLTSHPIINIQLVHTHTHKHMMKMCNWPNEHKTIHFRPISLFLLHGPVNHTKQCNKGSSANQTPGLNWITVYVKFDKNRPK